tara:strand:+ start:196 stop:315 length:120 start_codon:yes stop_codon:yes gene_type:complete
MVVLVVLLLVIVLVEVAVPVQMDLVVLHLLDRVVMVEME